MPKLNELIAYALKIESEFEVSLQAYYKMSRREAAERFLLSLLGQSREHVKSLQELRQEGNLDELSWQTQADYESEVFKPDGHGKEKLNFNSPEFLDFLTVCIKRKELTLKLYKFLAAHIANQDVAFLFQRLADEERKQKDMLLDRYELEIICSE